MANTKYKISFSLYTKGILYRVSPDTFSEHIDSPNIYNSEVLVVPMPKRSYINGSYLDINGDDNDENKPLEVLGQYLYKLNKTLKNSLIYLADRSENYDTDSTISFYTLSDCISESQFIEYFLDVKDFYIIFSDTILTDNDSCFYMSLIKQKSDTAKYMTISQYDSEHYKIY